MMRLSKGQFNRAIEDNTVAGHDRYLRPSSNDGPKRASRFVITALIATIGIGAGWVGGKVLSGRLGSSSAVAPSSDVYTELAPAPLIHPSETQPPAKRSSGVGNAAAPQSEPAPDPTPINIEPPPKQAASAAPPPVPRVNKEEEEGTAEGEDPAKEIGRKALKKIVKENEKMKRERGNKNENDQN